MTPVLRPLLVQSAVMVGVWWALLVDVLGNWAGQDHAPCWMPIIEGTAVSVLFVHAVAACRIVRLRREGIAPAREPALKAGIR